MSREKEKEKRTKRQVVRVRLGEKEAAEYLGVTVRTMQRRRRDGVVRSDGSIRPTPPFYRPAGKICYEKTEIDAWIMGA